MANIVIGGTGANKGGGGKGANKGGGKGVNPYKGLTPGMAALTNPSNPAIAGRDLINAAHAYANAQTVGPLGELARQIAQTNKGTTAAEKLTGGYFNQFGKSAQQGVQDEAAIGNQLQSTLSGIGAKTDTALQGIGQDAQNAVQAYMPAGDPSLSSPAMQSLVGEIARQRGYASQYSGIAQGSGALQSANYGGMAAAEKGIGAAQGTQALGELARAGRLAIQPLTSKVATLDQTRGALYANELNAIRQQGTANLITEQGLGNTAAGIQATSANEQANRQATARQNRLNRQAANTRENTIQTGETNRTNAEIAARKATAAAHAVATGKKPKLTPYELAHENANLGRAIAFVTRGKQKGIAVGQINTDAPTALGAYYDPVLLQAAIEIVQGGGTITPQTAAVLHQMGLRGSTYNGSPVTVRGRLGSGVASSGQGAAGGVSSVAG